MIASSKVAHVWINKHSTTECPCTMSARCLIGVMIKSRIINIFSLFKWGFESLHHCSKLGRANNRPVCPSRFDWKLKILCHIQACLVQVNGATAWPDGVGSTLQFYLEALKIVQLSAVRHLPTRRRVILLAPLLLIQVMTWTNGFVVHSKSPCPIAKAEHKYKKKNCHSVIYCFLSKVNSFHSISKRAVWGQ